MSKRKIMLLAAALVMVAVLGIGGTLAYFTDKDEEINTFTVGNVDITLTESDVIGVRDQTNGLLNYKDNDSEGVWSDDDGVEYKNLMPGSNVVKDPTVTNVGENDVYVRIFVKHNHNEAIFTYYTEELFNANIFGVNNAVDKIDVAWKLADGTYGANADNWKGQDLYGDMLDADEKMYVFYVTAKLLPNQTFTVFESFTVPTSFNTTELEAVFENLEIELIAHGIQADGFTTVKDAFVAYDAQTAAN